MSSETDKVNSVIEALNVELESFKDKVDAIDYGVVLEAGDGIIKAIGLENVFLGEIVSFLGDGLGMVMKIDPDTVSIILFNKIEEVSQGCKIFATKKPLSINVDESLLGRVIDPLGNPLDGLGPISCSKTMLFEAESPGVMQRESVCEPLQTGIRLIDLLIPIGLGQKQLILGDRQTGKTAITIDTIINQSIVKENGGKAAFCIYVAIAKKASEIAKIVQLLKDKGAINNTIVIATTASDTTALQYVAPMAGVAIAEYFRDKQKDALVVLDDLTKHADAYREISLLMRRTPARGAYPGDVFYLHSRLLERAVKLKSGGSVTILPIIETLDGDVSSYIPTNVISITDGQMYLDKEIFYKGQRPAINIGLSVSRIGSAAQHANMKQISGTLKGELAQYIELKNFSKSVSDVDEETKEAIQHGDILMSVLRQKIYSPTPKAQTLLMLLGVECGAFNDLFNIEKFAEEMFFYMNTQYPLIIKSLSEDNKLTKTEKSDIFKQILDFKKIFEDDDKGKDKSRSKSKDTKNAESEFDDQVSSDLSDLKKN
ncbi:F0F1 ATP synthase subunit alpha [Alphaproteobacteria bacterium endosymbiont of Tiliacea citrago]|uniref:F0F1 ATP synthase subunit alpha n=1 Tax=Alphaproteobacteria bacterium endosymbiont of Tiliacea citrago TaxID=3077944 RepID=UPI00313B6496